MADDARRARRRQAALALTAMAAALAWLYAPVVLGLETFYLGDFTWTTTPLRAFSAAALRAGRLPDWNPLIMCGLPHAANPLAATFSPTTPLYFVLPVLHAASLELVVGYGFGALGAYVVARQLGVRAALAAAAGVVYALSGPLAASPAVGVHGLAAGWLPWAVAGALAWGRGARLVGIATSAAALALVLSAGEPELVTVGAALCAATLCAAEAPWRARLGALAAVGALAVALGAAQLLPALAFQPHSVRAAGIPLDEAERWSLHPARLATYVWPYFFGKATPVNSFWGGFITDDLNDRTFMYASLYVGAATLPLAALGLAGDRRGRWLGGVALALVLLALGRYLPLFALLHHLPPISLSRYPERYLLPVGLVLALGGALGAERALGARAPLWPIVVLAVVALASALLAATATAWQGFIRARSPVPNFAEAAAQLRTDGVHVALVCALAALVVALVRRGRLRPGVAVVALWALTAGDVALTARGVVATRPMSSLPAANPTVDEVRRILGDARQYRFWRVPSLNRQSMPKVEAGLWRNYDQQALTLRSNLPMLDGLADVGGHSAARPRDLFGADAELTRDLDLLAPASVRAIVAPLPLPGPLAARVADGRLRLERAAPRIGVALVSVPSARPRVRCQDAAGAVVDGCALIEDAAGALHVRATLAAPATLTTGETALPGWRARLDGAVVPTGRSRLGFVTVALPAGAHEVTLTYRAPGLRAGVVVSLLSWLALALACVVARRRR